MNVVKVALLCVALATAACDPPLDVAPDVKLAQLQGTWYEIAHLPRPTEQGCSHTVATYKAIDSSKMGVVHDCVLANGEHLTSTAALYASNPSEQGRLKIDLGGFLGDYDVLYMAPDQSWFVVGHPSRQYLWILARDKHMAQSDIDAALKFASDDGFDTTKIEYTDQDSTPPPAPPPSSGCDAGGAGGAHDGAGLILTMAGLLALTVRRRRTQ